MRLLSHMWVEVVHLLFKLEVFLSTNFPQQLKAACVNANIFHLQVNIHTPLEKVVTCYFNSANSHSSSKFAQVFKHRQYKRWTLPL